MKSKADFKTHIPFVLKYMRDKLGYLQYEVAEALHVDKSALCRWESGERIPKLYDMYKLSKFYNVSIDEILEEDFPNATIQKDETSTIEDSAVDFARQHSPRSE